MSAVCDTPIAHAETDRKIWKHTAWDGLLLTFSVVQVGTLLALAEWWGDLPLAAKAAGLIIVTAMITYNIIVVSHLFTHVEWFTSPKLNSLVSVLNSINIGQSVHGYQLTHVRNHHRFNNDQKGLDGTTKDASSTYRGGRDGDHEPLLRYALGGALRSFAGRAVELASVTRLWRAGKSDADLLALISRRQPRRNRELRQLQADRAAHCLSLVVFSVISWQWAVCCYLPAFFIALTLVNVQNYYRHYGANPVNRFADSVSHYGRLYNLLTFNDGYHQEHHLSPATHWSQMPTVHERQRARMEAQPRLISPVPAMFGFLDHKRPLLHRARSA